MKLRAPMLAATSDVAVAVMASMAVETGGVKKSPNARAAARVVAGVLEPAAFTMRPATPRAVAATNLTSMRARSIRRSLEATVRRYDLLPHRGCNASVLAKFQ